jgi:hypothetical protein
MRLRVLPRKREWGVFLWCVLAASGFWFLRAMDKKYTATLHWPLRIVRDSASYKAIEKGGKREILIQVHGHGWEIVKRQVMLKVSPLEINKEEIGNRTYLLASDLQSLVVSTIGNLTIEKVLSDTIRLVDDVYASKPVVLAVDLKKLRMAKGCRPSENPELVPSSILVSGPMSKLSNVPDTIYLDLSSTEISTAFDKKVSIPTKPLRGQTCSAKEVQVRFPVGQYILIKRTVPFTTRNFPKNKAPIVPEGKIQIRYYLPVSKRINDPIEAYRVILDYERLDPIDSTVSPLLIQAPDFSREIELSPRRISLVNVKN